MASESSSTRSQPRPSNRCYWCGEEYLLPSEEQGEEDFFWSDRFCSEECWLASSVDEDR